ncbi:putative esterase [Actinobacillus pleuropneumoniae]|nr:putative esterase [Actinobacillus pleuropneumoniae]
MHFERRSHWSGELGREMHFNVYGHAGKPVIVFPSSGGNQNEYGNFGMIEACRAFIDRGLIKFYTPDSYDSESWLALHKSGHDMALAHNAYDRYIVHELVPLIRHESNWNGTMIATGCSMGAFHSVNFALRHPDLFDTTIALSGVYDARFFTGEFYGDPTVYFNSPIDSLWGQNDDWFLNRYRQIILLLRSDRVLGKISTWKIPAVYKKRLMRKGFKRGLIIGGMMWNTIGRHGVK